MIAIIAFSNVYCAPYIDIYKEILDNLKLEYVVYYLNRENIDEDHGNRQKGMIWESLRYMRRFEKIYNMLRYRCYIKKQTKAVSFDFLILLTTLPSILLFDLLLSKYRKQYIVDVRDYTNERNSIFRIIEKSVFHNAALVTISSTAFQNFLPKSNYILSHNTSLSRFAKTEGINPFSARCNNQITVGYVGTIAYPDTCIAFAKLVANDKRFAFHLYGFEVGNKVSRFVDNLRAENVIIMGKYIPSQKAQICRNVDILFNAYGNASPLLDYALSNKYYDALFYGKPVLNSPNTYMHESLGMLSFAFNHLQDSSLDGLYDWYTGLDIIAANELCRKKILKIRCDYKAFSDKVTQALLGRVKVDNNA